jgi:hypothetical protein
MTIDLEDDYEDFDDHGDLDDGVEAIADDDEYVPPAPRRSTNPRSSSPVLSAKPRSGRLFSCVSIFDRSPARICLFSGLLWTTTAHLILRWVFENLGRREKNLLQA